MKVTGVSPKQLLAWVSIFTLLLTFLSAYVALKIPASGIQYVPADLTQTEQKGIIIQSVKQGSSAHKAGLQADLEITAISNTGENWFVLNSSDILEEPDLLGSYQAYFEFLERQDQLYNIISKGEFSLQGADGSVYQLTAENQGLSGLPFIYWFQVICGIIVILTGFSVFAFRQSDPASLQYAINGFSFLLITLAASVYSSRELAMPSSHFYALNMVNHFGSLVFSATFVSLFFLYPKRLTQFSWHWLVLGIYIALFIADLLQVFPSHDESLRIPIMIALLMSGVLAVFQRYKVRDQLIEKAALRWFVLSLLIGGGLFVFVSILMGYLGIHTEIPQGYSLGFILIMYLGIALGITRYKLFQLESWWFNIWIWILGGALLLSFDAFLTYLLGINENLSIGLSLALLGWLYFPIRQWLAKKIFSRRGLNLSDVFPQVLTLLLSSSQKRVIAKKWQGLLSDIFQPMKISEIDTSNAQVLLINSGEALHIPSVEISKTFELTFPDHGKRFFTTNDLKLAQGLWELLSHALVEKDAFEQGSAEERKRIGRDLHDDIGTRLLTLIHKTQDKDLALLAKDAMRDLRVVLNSLDDNPRVLIDSLGDWRGEVEERCALQDIELEWQQDEIAETFEISSRQFINIQRVIRETLTNALKHSSPTLIIFQIRLNKKINIKITQNGCENSIETWNKGRGLSNIDFRISELSGTISRTQQNDEVITEINIPV